LSAAAAFVRDHLHLDRCVVAVPQTGVRAYVVRASAGYGPDERVEGTRIAIGEDPGDRLRMVEHVTVSVVDDDGTPLGLMVAGTRERRGWSSDPKTVDEAFRLASFLAPGLQNFALEKLNRDRAKFFANVSHELRTPLTLSIGPLEMILDRLGLDAEIARHLRTVHAHQLRMLKLISDLLDLSKLEEGRAVARFRRHDMVTTLGFYLDSLQPAAESRGMELELDAPKKAIEVYLDADKFEKMIMNLLSNAFKFTPDGGRITVAVREGNKTIDVSVNDTGIGIARADLARLFQRYVQLEASDTRRYAGTGIGLSLVKELMEMHRGSVEVTSEPGMGSTFTLRFQRGRDHLDPSTVEEAAPDRITSRPRPDVDIETVDLPRPPRAGENSVLVVDDTAGMRSFLDALLDPHYRVLHAKDGMEALEIARREVPELVIADVMMPRMSGYELCSALRSEQGPLSSTPVILVTAKAEMSMKLEALDVGADAYLVKPFSADELVIRARNLVRVHAQERQIAEDMQQARAFQQSMLPQTPESNLVRFSTVYRPAGVVGGDIYDISMLGDRTFRVFLADAPGHGVQASLRTMIIKSEYERVKMSARRPHEVLWMLNERIVSGFTSLNLHFSACCFDVSIGEDGSARIGYANAGQPPLLLLRGGVANEIYRPGPLIGLVSGIEIETEQHPFQIGDRIYAFTDGLYEEWNAEGKVYGFERVSEVLGRSDRSLDEACAEAMDDLERHVARAEMADDVLLIGAELVATPN
jgi:signal transduction histidine kinase/serine phosphatase RsbU (regulator of sigma subunit)